MVSDTVLPVGAAKAIGAIEWRNAIGAVRAVGEVIIVLMGTLQKTKAGRLPTCLNELTPERAQTRLNWWVDIPANCGVRHYNPSFVSTQTWYCTPSIVMAIAKRSRAALCSQEVGIRHLSYGRGVVNAECASEDVR